MTDRPPHQNQCSKAERGLDKPNDSGLQHLVYHCSKDNSTRNASTECVPEAGTAVKRVEKDEYSDHENPI